MITRKQMSLNLDFQPKKDQRKTEREKELRIINRRIDNSRQKLDKLFTRRKTVIILMFILGATAIAGCFIQNMTIAGISLLTHAGLLLGGKLLFNKFEKEYNYETRLFERLREIELSLLSYSVDNTKGFSKSPRNEYSKISLTPTEILEKEEELQV